MNSALRQALFFAVVFAIAVASYFLVFRPVNARIAKAKKETDLKMQMLAKLREANSQSADLERANAEMKQGIEAIEARLPGGKEIDSVLRQVAQIAEKCSLTIPEFKRADKPLQAGLVLEQPLNVTINGDFDGYYRFLLELEKLPRITRIPDMSITRQNEPDGSMSAKLVLSIYYQGDASIKP